MLVLLTGPLNQACGSTPWKGRGRGLRLLANRLGWIPQRGGWQCQDQYFTWYEADYKVTWDSAKMLLNLLMWPRNGPRLNY
eukprot:991815-Amphidinium_carterae.2